MKTSGKREQKPRVRARGKARQRLLLPGTDLRGRSQKKVIGVGVGREAEKTKEEQEGSLGALEEVCRAGPGQPRTASVEVSLQILM